MTIKDMFNTLIKTFNPDSYKELDEYPFSKTMKYFGFILFWSLVVMFLLFIPALISFPSFWQDTTSHFDKLELNYDVSVKDTFNVLNDPMIRISKDRINLTNERLLITENSVYYKQFFFFGRTETAPLEKQTDLMLQDAQVNTGLMLLFAIPSLFFWLFVFFSIYFWIVIFITFSLGMLFSWILKLNHGASSILKFAAYSSTILVLLQLILMPFFRLFFLPIIIYWILFLIVLLITKQERDEKGRGSERRYDRKHGRREREDIFAPHQSTRHSKSKDIFANHSDSSSKSKSNSYDVDERGNIKLSQKKKNSSDDSYDDYVMLK